MGELNLNNFNKPTTEEMEAAKLKASVMKKVGEEVTGEVKEMGYEVDPKTGLVVEKLPIEKRIDNFEDTDRNHR
ncbi:MAG: hypothetical protein WCI93_03705 [bacterium]